MKTVDLKEYALKLLDLSKKFLAEDGDLDPTAFIITTKDPLVRPINIYSEPEGEESCIKIIEEARKNNALAIITVFLARSKDFTKENFDEETYLWGDIQGGDSERCILVTLSGPGIKNWVSALPFTKINDKVIFQKRIEFSDGVQLGLFPGWSDLFTEPEVS